MMRWKKQRRTPGMTRKTQMRTVVILIVMSFVSSLLSQGQSIPIAEPPTPARTYHLLREDDDWSFLAMVDWNWARY